MTDTPDLPMAVEGVTREWVAEKLQERYPGTELTSFRHGRFIGGTGSKLQILLEYNQVGRGYGLPPSMIVKGGFEWHEVAFAPSYQAEGIFFRDWAPGLTVNIPRGFYGGRNERQGIAIMEDLTLRGVTFGVGDPIPLSPDVVEKAVRLLAHLHASYWNDPKIETLRSLGERVGTNFIGYALEPGYYAQCLSEVRGSTVPMEFRDPDFVLKGLKANWAQAETGPQSFVHGDPHQGNMFFEANGKPGFLDFAAYVRSSPLHDINYTVVGSLSVDDRRAHERDLLRVYLDELAARKVEGLWSWDEAWERYRRHTMHGLLWFTNPIEMQPIPVTEAHGLRFGTAASDLKLSEALGL